MANYAVVKEDKILELHDYIPLLWNNVSNFNLIENKPELLEYYGWRKVIKRVPEFDSEIQILSEPKYIIENDYVVETFDVINVYANKSEFYNVRKQEILNNIRKNRDDLLKESDWTQNVDLVGIKSEEWILSWRKYRQLLRDLPFKYESVENLNYDQIKYPQKPD